MTTCTRGPARRAVRFAEDEREAHKQRAIAEERTAPRRALAGAMLPAT
jgi:hypothetical protein